MPPDSPTEFDFDFQVGKDPADQGGHLADEAPSNGSGSEGAGAATPSPFEDLDAPARTGNGAADPSPSPRRRRFTPAGSGDGDGGRTNGRGNGGRTGRRRRERAGAGDPDGSDLSPEAGAGEKLGGILAAGKRRLGRARPKLVRADEGAPREDPAGADGEAEDWLSLTDRELGGNGLDALPQNGGTTAEPRNPREGRQLARAARDDAARRRAEGASRVDESDVPFESMLKRQPQKSKAMRRASPLLDAMRDATGEGADRLRNGGARLRYGFASLRYHGGARLRQLRGAPAEASNGRPPPRLPRISSRRPRRPKQGRIKRLRLLVVVAGLGLLAVVSAFFGMMMAISRDLPSLETKKFFDVAQRSELFDNHGRRLGTLLNNNQQILVSSAQISPYMKEAAVAIEDQRFYEHSGVDIKGMVRAAIADLLPGGSTQGASTITQQFVKNALEAQGSRTVLQKFREAAIAYHLERQWDKDKILTAYLNTIYFGEGAYGIEAAARTYFGYNHPGCGGTTDPCASELDAAEAAMLAGIISAPSAFSPRLNPAAAKDRRDLVLSKMKDQGILSDEEYNSAIAESLPTPSEIQKPTEDSQAPFFTSWLRQLIVNKYGPGRAFGGGLQIHTTLDLDMQKAVEDIAYNHLAGIQPTASVVVLDNKTGEIRAMVGGSDYQKSQFNIATQGERQPGSTFKAFILAAALNKGISPNTVYSSQPKTFVVPNSGGKEHFEVKNYEGNYLGSCSITCATTYSDNSIYAELGIDDVGTKPIAHMARDMGIQDPVTHNPAMVLGAPGNAKKNEYCCTPLEMTHAFETIAANGDRISGNLDTIEGDTKSPRDDGPVPINKIVGPNGDVIAQNHTTRTRVLSASNAATERSILATVVSSGTGTHAQGPPDAWGKTGTTEDYGNAWFCGGSTDFTACVWVGYPNKVIPMQTDYGGQPVAGGTYPAEIWSAVMQAVESIYAGYGSGSGGGSSGSSYTAPSSGSSSYSAPSSGGGGGGSGNSAPAAPAPSSGGGGGGGTPSGGGVGL